MLEASHSLDKRGAKISDSGFWCLSQVSSPRNEKWPSSYDVDIDENKKRTYHYHYEDPKEPYDDDSRQYVFMVAEKGIWEGHSVSGCRRCKGSSDS